MGARRASVFLLSGQKMNEDQQRSKVDVKGGWSVNKIRTVVAAIGVIGLLGAGSGTAEPARLAVPSLANRDS